MLAGLVLFISLGCMSPCVQNRCEPDSFVETCNADAMGRTRCSGVPVMALPPTIGHIPCSPGEVCVTEGRFAYCVADEAEACEIPTARRCRGDGLQTCVAVGPRMWRESRTCEGDSRRVQIGDNAGCMTTDEPCEDHRSGRCVGNEVQWCRELLGADLDVFVWSRHDTCDDEVCHVDFGALCAAEPPETCTADDTERCVDGRIQRCTRPNRAEGYVWAWTDRPCRVTAPG